MSDATSSRCTSGPSLGAVYPLSTRPGSSLSTGLNPRQPGGDATLAFQVDRSNPADESKWSQLPFDDGNLGAGDGNMTATARIGGSVPCRDGDQFVIVAYNVYGRTVTPVTLQRCVKG